MAPANLIRLRPNVAYAPATNTWWDPETDQLLLPGIAIRRLRGDRTVEQAAKDWGQTVDEVSRAETRTEPFCECCARRLVESERTRSNPSDPSIRMR